MKATIFEVNEDGTKTMIGSLSEKDGKLVPEDEKNIVLSHIASRNSTVDGLVKMLRQSSRFVVYRRK